MLSPKPELSSNLYVVEHLKRVGPIAEHAISSQKLPLPQLEDPERRHIYTLFGS